MIRCPFDNCVQWPGLQRFYRNLLVPNRKWKIQFTLIHVQNFVFALWAVFCAFVFKIYKMYKHDLQQIYVLQKFHIGIKKLINWWWIRIHWKSCKKVSTKKLFTKSDSTYCGKRSRPFNFCPVAFFKTFHSSSFLEQPEGLERFFTHHDGIMYIRRYFLHKKNFSSGI